MGIFSFVKAGGKKFGSIVGTGPKVNKTKLDKAKTNLAIGKQKLQGSTAKLKQTQFEIKNKLPLTFGKSSKKTMSNTERAQKAALRKDDKKQETKTKHFYAPKNFNKGGRVGLKGGTNLGMQSVKYGLDNNPKITAADPKAKFIAANKKKKSKSPMDKTVRKA
jgi:hypothetical protein